MSYGDFFSSLSAHAMHVHVEIDVIIHKEKDSTMKVSHTLVRPNSFLYVCKASDSLYRICLHHFFSIPFAPNLFIASTDYVTVLL
jgi:hypothetical protein